MEREINLLNPKIVVGESGQVYENETQEDNVLGTTDKLIVPEVNQPTTQVFVEGE